jgi:GT2 family glycosyltransferase
VSIAIVTPWQNHLELESDFFAAIETGKPDQLVVVDDGSDPPLPFAAVRLDKPGGFSTATNAGLAAVETDQVLFLNNDVLLLRPGWLDEIRNAISPGVLVGPLVVNNPLSIVDGKFYPYIDGWCLGMTTADARMLGGWDEAYDTAGPAYFSDNALSLKANVTGAGMALRDLRPGLAHKAGQTGGGKPGDAVSQARFQYALAVNGQLFQEQVRAARK